MTRVEERTHRRVDVGRLVRDGAVRRAARAAVVMPAMFALGQEVIGNPTVAVYAAIGSFALMLLVEFGGPMRERLQAQAAPDPRRRGADLPGHPRVDGPLGRLAGGRRRRVRRALRRRRQLGARRRQHLAAAGDDRVGLAARQPGHDRLPAGRLGHRRRRLAARRPVPVAVAGAGPPARVPRSPPAAPWPPRCGPRRRRTTTRVARSDEALRRCATGSWPRPTGRPG